MKSYQILRLNISPYQAKDFIHKEKAELEKINGIHYVDTPSFNHDQETILITNTHTDLSLVDKRFLKNTKLILHPNSGYDNLEKDLALIKNIPLLVGHSIRAQGVAEYILSSLFQAMTELPQHLNWDTQRKWDRRLISDSEIIIFGYGHIGQIVAQTLHALGAKIKVIDPYVSQCPFPFYKNFKEIDLKTSQVIISAMGLNQTSLKIFSEDFFNQLNPEVIFINGARGKLVDEESLKYFLKLHPKAQAFLDVFSEEPFQESWRNIPQVWKTSHIAGVSRDLDQKIINFERMAINDFIKLNQGQFKERYQRELLENKLIKGILI